MKYLGCIRHSLSVSRVACKAAACTRLDRILRMICDDSVDLSVMQKPISSPNRSKRCVYVQVLSTAVRRLGGLVVPETWVTSQSSFLTAELTRL